jgi:hypothetical protein
MGALSSALFKEDNPMKVTNTHRFYTLALILSLFLSACGAVQTGNVQGDTVLAKKGDIVIPLGLIATLQGLQSVVEGAPSTSLLTNGKLVLMAWPVGPNYGFAIFSADGKPVMDILEETGFTSNLTQQFTWCNLLSWAMYHGWKTIIPGDLPPMLLASIQAYTVTSLQMGAQALPTILILPAISLPTTQNSGIPQ